MLIKFHDKITKKTLWQFLCENNQLQLLDKIYLIFHSLEQTKHYEEEKEEKSEGN